MTVAPAPLTPSGTVPGTTHTRPLQLAIFDNEKATRPRNSASPPWDEVVTLLNFRNYRPDKSGLMLGGYDLSGSRKNQNVRSRSIVQLDIDTDVKKDKRTGHIISVSRPAPAVEAVRKKIAEYEWIASSSHSHDPAAGIIKYRITMLPDRNILPDEHEAVLEALDELLGGCLDRAAWPLSQAFYLPSCPAPMAADAFSIHNKGAPLPVDRFVTRGCQIIIARQSVPTQRAANINNRPEPDTPRRRAVLQDALNYIPANRDRNEWRDIVWAILSTGWHDAEAIAKAWSMTAPHYYTDEGFAKVVSCFDPQHSQTPTLGTLFYFARLGGWNG